MSALSTFDEIVAQIQLTTGCDRVRAEQIATQNGYQPRVSAEARENAREKDEQIEVAKVYRAFGFKVYSLSQPRATKQTPGIPDLWCVHRSLPIAFWHETKRTKGGRVSEQQQEFRDDCLRAGVGHVLGDRYAARSHLITLGLAHVVGGALEPIHRTPGAA